MKNILKILIIAIIGLVFSSCDKFINGLVVEVDVPEHEPVLVPYCFINAEDTVIKVYVQQSQGILDSTNRRYIDNATVELYKNGTLWKTLSSKVVHPNTGEIYYQTDLSQPMSAEGYGDTYELRVSAPDFELVTATQVMPFPKSISEIQHLRRSANNFGDLIDNTRVTIDDTPNEENYYRVILAVFEIGTIADGDTVYRAESFGGQTIINTESLSNALDGVVMTDKLFDGQLFTADIGTSPSGISRRMTDEPITYSGIIKTRFLSITRDEYLYQKSLFSYETAGNNPFAEPTLLYSNTSSGLGIFSMMAETKEDFIF